MATNPNFSPYKTQRFSFIGSPQQRDGSYTKDQRFLNMYPEMIKSPVTDGKKYYLKKRPGYANFHQMPQATSQGAFYWQANNGYYYAVGGILYDDGNIPVLTTMSPTNDVGICEFRNDTTRQLFVCDGNQAWLINQDNTNVPITNANLPKPHIPAPVFLDGYIFLAQPASQRICNSNLNDPTTWPTDGFIDAEMYADDLVYLTKNQNYVVAVGQSSIEFFYDNANATGSPLQRNAPAVSQFGCPAHLTVNQTEKEIILVGTTDSGGRTVWLIDGFQPKEIGNEPVREALDLEGDSIGLASAFSIQCCGHKWYVLNLYGNSRTFVYDFEEEMWHEWSTGSNQTFFIFKYAMDSGDGSPVLLGYQGGWSVRLNPQYYTDQNTPIHCVVTTTKLDFDTMKRKRFFRLSLVTDSPNGAGNSPMTVEWSDDDYNTWLGQRTLLINSSNPTITQLGQSRRRAFRFTYTDNYPLRMEAFEVDIIAEQRR